MTPTILNIREIVSDPQVRGGRPVIAGMGLTVMNIVLTHTTGDQLSLDDIAAHYRLTLGQVYTAMAYYHLHQAELDEQLRQEMAETGQLIDEIRKQGQLIE
jgi:uncharacterized protein (DUF433 family)